MSSMACCTLLPADAAIAYGTGVAKVFVPLQVLLRKDIEQLMNSKAQKVN